MDLVVTRHCEVHAFATANKFDAAILGFCHVITKRMYFESVKSKKTSAYLKTFGIARQ